MSLGHRCTTMSILLLLGLGLFPVISVTMELPDVIYLGGPSGEFNSSGYPNTHPVLVFWNINVGEDRRIILQFLDFELVESGPPCVFDTFELYDGDFNEASKIGDWCWNSFDDLTPTTYISSGNVFILRFRAIEGRSRKGFKANYSSIPKEVTTTTFSNVVQTTALNRLTTPTKNAKGTSNVAVMTSPTSGLDGAGSSPGVFVAIIAGVIVIIIIIIIIVVVILVVWKYKINSQAQNASPDLHSESSSRTISIEMYEEIKTEQNVDIEGSNENKNQTGDGEKLTPATDSSMNVQQSDVYSKSIIRQDNIDTVDGVKETPDVPLYSYADPNELKLGP